MWDETLIESMGKRNNGKRWLTVQIAAIVHAGVVAILVAASFWYADVMTLPVQSEPIRGVFISETLPPSPPPLGVRHQTSEVKPVSNNSEPVEAITQDKLVPEEPNFVAPSTPFSDPGNLGDLPQGDPNGVSGALPGGTGSGGFGSGIPGDQPVNENDFRKLGVEQPVLIHRIEPVYPKLALVGHIQGTIVLRALITNKGDVQNITILQGSHPFLNQAAVEGVSRWKYKPATLEGRPIAVYFQVTVVFKIR